LKLSNNEDATREIFSRVAAFSDQSFDRVFDDVPWCQYRFIFFM